jgi:hypothetical protein
MRTNWTFCGRDRSQRALNRRRGGAVWSRKVERRTFEGWKGLPLLFTLFDRRLPVRGRGGVGGNSARRYGSIDLCTIFDDRFPFQTAGSVDHSIGLTAPELTRPGPVTDQGVDKEQA